MGIMVDVEQLRKRYLIKAEIEAERIERKASAEIEQIIRELKKYDISEADYEARLKADMVAMLEDLRFQAEENIENIYEKDEDNILMLTQHNAFADCFAQYNSLIEERIDALKGD